MADDPIWAPWRLGYIVGNKELPSLDDSGSELLAGAEPGCFLCQAAVATDQQGRHVVHRGEHAVTVLNLYPYNNGHMLVAPKQHVARLDQIGEAVHRELSQTMTRMVALLEETIHPEGFNIGLNLGQVAGAGVPGHLHWHIVPRWSGDTNFMPVVGNTNIIPQSLDALWSLLTENLARREAAR